MKSWTSRAASGKSSGYRLLVPSAFLSFMLVFVGGLRAAQVSSEWSVQNSGIRATLSTSSPDLVLAALGTIVLLFTYYVGLHVIS